MFKKLQKYFNMPTYDKDAIIDAYDDLDYETRKKVQVEVLGRKLQLVATNVDTVDEIDIPNFFDGIDKMELVENVWLNKHPMGTPSQYDASWDEYADVYIYATDEEIKGFTKFLKKCLYTPEWFGTLYEVKGY